MSVLAAAALGLPRAGSAAPVADAMLFVERDAPGSGLRSVVERQRSADHMELTPELAIAPLRLESPATVLPTSPVR